MPFPTYIPLLKIINHKIVPKALLKWGRVSKDGHRESKPPSPPIPFNERVRSPRHESLQKITMEHRSESPITTDFTVYARESLNPRYFDRRPLELEDPSTRSLGGAPALWRQSRLTLPRLLGEHHLNPKTFTVSFGYALPLSKD